MDVKCSAEIVSFKKNSKIENVWPEEDYRALWSLMGLEDGLDAMNPGERKEMCLMSLNDSEPEEAARAVLPHLFNGAITEGEIDQLRDQMPENNGGRNILIILSIKDSLLPMAF